MAAFTPTVTVDEIKAIKHEVLGDMMIIVKLACTDTDGDTGASLTMKSTRNDSTDTYRAIMDRIEGSWLYMMEVVPGAGGDAPATAFDIDIENKRNSHILDTDSNSNTATSFVLGSNTLGGFPPIMDQITVVIGALGAGKKADIYLYFSK
jgi:hypothetical protein